MKQSKYFLKTSKTFSEDDKMASARLLKQAGYKTIIVTNQSAIARGWLTEEKLSEINKRMYKLLNSKNPQAVIDDLYFCPFHKEGTVPEYAKESEYRKPNTGMIKQAVSEHDIDLSRSYMIGDSLTDIQFGNNAGIKNVLVLTGYGKITKRNGLDEKAKIEFIAEDISEAAKYITDHESNNV